VELIIIGLHSKIRATVLRLRVSQPDSPRDPEFLRRNFECLQLLVVPDVTGVHSDVGLL
jgi:hypothetical protein